MNSSTRNEYMPDYVAPPGETLLEALEDREMSQADLAERTGRPAKTINEIVQGKTAITPETALQFERVLCIPASFWINLEAHYQEYIARKKDLTALEGQIEWLKDLPIKEMVNAGWLKPCKDRVQQLQNALQYFGVVSPEVWRETWLAPAVSYRTSPAFAKNPGAVAAWLRKGELEAQQITCASFDKDKFIDALTKIRELIGESIEVIQSRLPALAAEAGVAIVFVDTIAGAPISGATRWLSPKKALIQLSYRYKTYDQLWFAFFHEAGHILLHGKRETFIDDDSVESVKEYEANQFSGGILVPEDKLEKFVMAQDLSLEAIEQFAAKIGVTPDIVVGQLHHKKVIHFAKFADAKRKLEWSGK